jgi:hypothetical protein
MPDHQGAAPQGGTGRGFCDRNGDQKGVRTMIISFSVFREKIESGEKCQTLRKYSPGQYRWYLNCWKKRETTGWYNLFWHNPRNGGTRIRDVVPSEKPFLICFNHAYGQMHINILRRKGLAQSPQYLQDDYSVLADIAKRDGFKNSSEMWEWFEKTYGKEMFQSKFMVVRWLP